MTVNLAWRDAMNAAGRQFTAEEHANGWPEAMQPKQLAALQRPFEWRDRTGRNAFNVLLQAIEDDCRMGSIHSTAEEVRICTRPAQDKGPSIFNLAYEHPDQYTRDGIRYAYTEPAEFKDVTRHHITPPDFAAWLAAQGEEPSKHIAEWFKSQEVKNGPLVQQPGPVMAEHETMLYSDLVKYRQTNPGAPWTNDMRALLANEEASRKNRPGAAGIRKSLGADMGCSDKRIGELIRGHETAQRNAQRAAANMRRTD